MLCQDHGTAAMHPYLPWQCRTHKQHSPAAAADSGGASWVHAVLCGCQEDASGQVHGSCGSVGQASWLADAVLGHS
jgi:hypothetical protein